MRSNVKIFFFTLLILFLSFLVPSAQQNSPKSKISLESDSLITVHPTVHRSEVNTPIHTSRPSGREDSRPLPILKAAHDLKEIPLDKERFRSFLDSIRLRRDSESSEPPPLEKATHEIVTGTEESTVVSPHQDIKCGDYLYSNTELTHDLNCTVDSLNPYADGLNLNADNITLDCKGHKIRGSFSGGYGVWIMNNKGNTICNCEITNFDEGIYIDNSDNNTVNSCTVDSNAFDGIYLTTGSDNNNILYSSILSNGWYLGSAGVYITTNSSSNVLFANYLTNNPEVGLKIDLNSNWNTVALNSFSNDKRAVIIDRAGQNSVISNMIENNTYYGILSSGATGDNYSRNLLHNNTYGIRLWSSGSNNRITENKIDNHLNYGIYIYNTDSGEVRHNLIDNTSYGIYFNHAYNWKAIADTIENCKNYGIYMESDTDVRIDSNYICSNKEDIRDLGYFLGSSSGDNNTCQFVYHWADDGEAEGCTHSCLLCGDVIQDSNINVTDVIYLINYLFKGGPAPLCPPSPYLDCADANGDGTVSVADVIYLINYLFKGGPHPVC